MDQQSKVIDFVTPKSEELVAGRFKEAPVVMSICVWWNTWFINPRIWHN
jgi:hypothetical protein